MAQLYMNVFGKRYEATEPCFMTIASGIKVWSRLINDWYDWDALEAKAIAESHTWQPREVGIPSIKWQLNNTYFSGWEFAPGLDNTSGLVSESVTNGEDWTGATGPTPPTGWTVAGLAPSFAIDTGVLHFGQNGAGDHTLSQTLTTVVGTAYVLEIKVGAGTTNSTMTFDGITLQLRAGAEFAVSYVATSTTIDVAFDIGGDGDLYLDYVRMYLESELTGSGGVAGIGGTPVDPIKGPYMSGTSTFWIDTDTCMVGFDVDSDPAPDLWLTPREVCNAKIEDSVKIAIDGQLQSDGCAGLPCMTKGGFVKASSHWEPTPVSED